MLILEQKVVYKRLKNHGDTSNRDLKTGVEKREHL